MYIHYDTTRLQECSTVIITSNCSTIIITSSCSATHIISTITNLHHIIKNRGNIYSFINNHQHTSDRFGFDLYK